MTDLPDERRSVVILGAGINGAAFRRELALGGLSVTVVDTHDLAFGATAYSSRLIHGGLRYLEYGEFDLVRESLAERARPRLAPQFVRPLKLYIPIAHRFGGLLAAAGRFFGFGRGRAAAQAAGSRGLWLVRIGLQLYDSYCATRSCPSMKSAAPIARRTCISTRSGFLGWAIYDASFAFPSGSSSPCSTTPAGRRPNGTARFELYTYHRAALSGRTVEISPKSRRSAILLRRRFGSSPWRSSMRRAPGSTARSPNCT